MREKGATPSGVQRLLVQIGQLREAENNPAFPLTYRQCCRGKADALVRRLPVGHQVGLLPREDRGPLL